MVKKEDIEHEHQRPDRHPPAAQRRGKKGIGTKKRKQKKVLASTYGSAYVEARMYLGPNFCWYEYDTLSPTSQIRMFLYNK